MPGWDQPGFAAAGWPPVQVLPHPDEAEKAMLVAQCNEPIRVVKELRPVKMTEPKPGVYVFDMGQNMVGWCRLKADAPAGTKITVRHAEMLNDDGTIYTANLRGAAQINEYTWRGGEAVLEPHFTYHGFRYVEVTGLPGRPAEDAIVGRVFHSAAPDAGQFSCSNELDQQDHALRRVGAAGQHDERAHRLPAAHRARGLDGRHPGLLADGDLQHGHGRLLHQVGARHPRLAGRRRPLSRRRPARRRSEPERSRACPPGATPAPSSPGGCIRTMPTRGCSNSISSRPGGGSSSSTATTRTCSGRRTAATTTTIGSTATRSCCKDYPRGISAVPNEVFATAFFAHSTEIVAKMADVLGRKDDAAKYGKLFEDIKAAFNRAYVAADGRIKGDTQAGYALALHFNLLDESLRPKATEHLLEAIKKYKDHPRPASRRRIA